MRDDDIGVPAVRERGTLVETDEMIVRDLKNSVERFNASLKNARAKGLSVGYLTDSGGLHITTVHRNYAV